MNRQLESTISGVHVLAANVGIIVVDRSLPAALDSALDRCYNKAPV